MYTKMHQIARFKKYYLGNMPPNMKKIFLNPTLPHPPLQNPGYGPDTIIMFSFIFLKINKVFF